MRYCDSSALIPLFVQQGDTETFKDLLREDPQIITWWGSRVECASTFNRLLRESMIDQNDFDQIQIQFENFASSWVEIQATEKLRQRALRLLRLHPLRAADALQLAAALVGCEESPQTLPFICSDSRLSDAAAKEGFQVLS